MKNKVDIHREIFEETKARYPWVNKMSKFEVLYHGWRTQGKRHGRNPQFFTVAWKRGWLAKKDADDLRRYIGLC